MGSNAELFSNLPDEYPEVGSLDLLVPRRRAFVLHYVLGEDKIRGNAKASYMAAGFTCKNEDVAAASGPELLRDHKVRQAILDIREELEKEFRAKMKSWAAIAVDAQELLERAILTAKDGAKMEAMGMATRLSTNQLHAIEMVLNRALGKPKAIVEREIGKNLADTIKRLASNRRVELPAGPSGQCVGVVNAGD